MVEGYVPHRLDTPKLWRVVDVASMTFADCPDKAEQLAFIKQALANHQAGPRALVASVAPTLLKSNTVGSGVLKSNTPGSGVAFATPAATPVPKTVVPAQRDLALAFHEAGHAATGVMCGLGVVNAEVFAASRTVDVRGTPCDVDGFCEFVHVDGLAYRRTPPEVIAAGYAAQAVYQHGNTPQLPAQIDALLRGTLDEKDLRRAVLETGQPRSTFTSEALRLVLRGWPAIVKLAVDMHDGNSIGHKHVTAALGLSNLNTQHAFELANIRAGLRAVPKS